MEKKNGMHNGIKKEIAFRGLFRRSFMMLLMAAMLLTGCAQSGEPGRQAPEKEDSFTADTDTVILTREGGLIGYICEEFDESRYRFADFETMLNNEVEDYNSQMGVGGIEIRECALADGIARISLSYANVEDYEKFNGVQFLCGQTPEEGARRFTLPADLKLVDAHDPTRTITLGELDAGQNYRILVTDDASNIRIHGSDIYYISEGDVLVGDGDVDTADDAALHVIIY